MQQICFLLQLSVEARVKIAVKIFESMQNKIKLFCLYSGAIVMLGNISGCVTPEVLPPLPQSAWGDRYDFSYQPAGEAKSAASVPVTIAVVNPNYKIEDSIFNTEPYRKIGKGLSASMGVDLDKILINKGITTTGPFPSLDEMTYSDKKNGSLTLAPQVFITMDIKNVGSEQDIGSFQTASQTGVWRADQNFVISVTGWVTFIMQEPLSSEKMWIKKLELDPVSVNGVICTEYDAQYTAGLFGPNLTGWNRGKTLYDGRPDALADAMKQIYPVVMSQFEKYIDTEELIQLKAQGDQIRSTKVFINN